MSDMGTFHISVSVESLVRPGDRSTLDGLLVDTGSELSWIPAPVLDALGITRDRKERFRQASGQVIERWVGKAIIHVGDIDTADDIVFGEPNDIALLGSRTLEGLNVIVDPVSRQLVDAGPAPAAFAA